MTKCELHHRLNVAVCGEMQHVGAFVFTWRDRERDVVLFAEVHRKDGVRGRVVTKPV